MPMSDEEYGRAWAVANNKEPIRFKNGLFQWWFSIGLSSPNRTALPGILSECTDRYYWDKEESESEVFQRLGAALRSAKRLLGVMPADE